MFAQFASAIAALTAFAGSVSAAPAPMFGLHDVKAANLTTRADQAGQAAPHFVLYSDKWVTGGAPAAADIAGYNVFALSFLLTTGATDQASNWATMADADRQKVKDAYKAANIKLVVSAFGSTETPTTSGVDAVQAADTMAAWVKKYELDGIDVDYEDLAAFNAGDGKAEQWLIDFTKELRKQLPASDYIVTHAPLGPWFTSDKTKYPGGGYLKVHTEVGDLIDWYNVQFYNQGTSEYVTCDGLLNKSSTQWPGTSVFEIVASGTPADKVVIGKPAATGDATNGFVDTATLATCITQAVAKKWNAGVMVWQYPDGDSAWLKTVRGTAL